MNLGRVGQVFSMTEIQVDIHRSYFISNKFMLNKIISKHWQFHFKSPDIKLYKKKS